MLACMACFNEMSLFRWPLVDGAAWLFVGWSAAVLCREAWRADRATRTTLDRCEVWLAALGLVVLSLGVWTLSWRVWMTLLALAWGGVLLARTASRMSRAWPSRIVGATCMALLLASIVHAGAAHRSAPFMVAWLGKLPPHARWDDAIARWLLQHELESRPQLLSAFRAELAGPRGYTNSLRISVLARVIGRINAAEATVALQQALAWRPSDESFGRSGSALAAIVVSYANNAGSAGFDDVWREYRRRQENASDEERLIWLAGLFVCDAARAAAMLSASELEVAQPKANSFGVLDASLQSLQLLIQQRLAHEQDDGLTVDEVLEQIYPPLSLPAPR